MTFIFYIEVILGGSFKEVILLWYIGYKDFNSERFGEGGHKVREV